MQGIQESGSGQYGSMSGTDQERLVPDKKMNSCWICFEKVRSTITVEAVLLLYYVAMSITNSANQQFIYARISQDHGFVKHGDDGQGCGAPNQTEAYKAMEKEVQSETSNFMVLSSAVTLLPLMVVSLFFGHYSDFAGRRLAILVSLAGAAVRVFAIVVISYYKANIYWLLLSSLIDSFTGGVVVLQTACYAYIADISPVEKRTLRLFLADAGSGIGFLIGGMIAGYSISNLDYTYTFVISIAFHAANALLVLFYIKESVQTQPKVAKLWSTSHLKASWNLFFKDGVQHNARKLKLCAAFLFAFAMAQAGAGDVQTLYLLGEPLCFGSTQLGWYQTISGMFAYMGGYISAKMLQKKVPDTGVLIMAGSAGVVAMTLFGFAETNILIWMAMIAAAFEAIGSPLVRSMSSKIVSKDQQGALFAALSFTQMLSGFVATSSFDAIYASTVKIYHGLVFFIGAMVFLVSVGIATILDINRRRELRDSSLPTSDAERATESADDNPNITTVHDSAVSDHEATEDDGAATSDPKNMPIDRTPDVI